VCGLTTICAGKEGASPPPRSLPHLPFRFHTSFFGSVRSVDSVETDGARDRRRRLRRARERERLEELARWRAEQAQGLLAKFSEPLLRLAQTLLLRDMRASAKDKDMPQRAWAAALLPLPPTNACAVEVQTLLLYDLLDVFESYPARCSIPLSGPFIPALAGPHTSARPPLNLLPMQSHLHIHIHISNHACATSFSVFAPLVLSLPLARTWTRC